MTADPPATEVITASELAERVTELGAAIGEDYRGRRPILVAMLVGAMPFLADLVRHIPTPVDIDFLALSRFGEGGRLRMVLDTSESLAGRDVIIVEDIVDTGLSLTVLRRMMVDREAASVATVSLLDKVPRRVVAVPIEYRGFEVGDEYLIGYGLDHDGWFRNLPAIWAVLDLANFQERRQETARLVYGHR
ncbi:MAG: hypoxanthine phosphoribosyltransferase [Acidimicrobiia bacterium]